MPYIGKEPVSRFQDIPAVQRFNGDGSDTTFTLNRTVSEVQDILVSVDGVIQDTTSYTIPDGTTLTFTSAPSNGTANIFVNYLGVTETSIIPSEEHKGNFKGGGIFRVNAQALATNMTILATENANVTGPFTVNSGVTLTINSGGTLVIL